MLLTVLAYLDRSALIATVLTQHPPLPDPDGPGSLPHRVAAAAGNLPSLRVLLEHHPTDLSSHDSEALRLAAWSGHASVVQFLLERHVAGIAAPGVAVDALQTASETDQPERIPALLSGVDPGARNSETLRNACFQGHTDVVRLLLDHTLIAAPIGIPCVDPSAADNRSLRDASLEGHADVVKLLLDHSFAARLLGAPCVDPSADDSQALRNASFQGHADVVKLLLDHSIVANSLGIPCVDPSVLKARAYAMHVSRATPTW
ncbi:hypothetical protein HDU96_001721 [Phlyctochytrium bullatum]|nr:hypothetical protein HDU96_001721 [Phlyctochytrium bullatum]